MNTPEYYMQLALDEAWKYQFLTYPNPAVGAVIVKDGQILAIAAHKKAGQPHAEVNACKEAFLTLTQDSHLISFENSFDIHNFLYENHNNLFKECSIYVTLEPCNHTGRTPACAQLLETLQFKEVFIGTLDPNKTASGGYERLKDISKVSINILQQKCDELLFPFKTWQKKSFSFFKLASRLDGSVNGGYITTQDSLNHVHDIRSNLDLLVIGGNTVRTDRPTLDTRFSKQKNDPDIFIYSKKKEFDTTIPLFKVENREVTISDDLNTIKEKNFIMIEGGYSMLDTVVSSCDMIMLFISCKPCDTTKTFEFQGFKKVHSFMINDIDKILFFQKVY